MILCRTICTRVLPRLLQVKQTIEHCWIHEKKKKWCTVFSPQEHNKFGPYFCLHTQQFEIYRINRTLGHAVENQFCASNDVYQVFHHITPNGSHGCILQFVSSSMNTFPHVYVIPNMQGTNKQNSTQQQHRNVIIIRKQNILYSV